jgi:hypothetical protein
MPNVAKFKLGALLHSFPAWDIYEAAPRLHLDLQVARPTFKSGDIVGIPFQTKNHGTLHNWFKFGSAVSYALAYCEDPIAAYSRCLKDGHPTHFLSKMPTVLTSDTHDKETRVAVDWGDEVIFEGMLFKIMQAPNSNAKLIGVEQ